MTERRDNDEAMADIMASIRRIVSDDAREPRPRSVAEAVLELTPDMRLDPADDRPDDAGPVAVAPPPPRPASQPTAAAQATPAQATPAQAAQLGAGASSPPLPGVDAAALTEAVRTVLRQEFAGALGKSLSSQVRKLVVVEVERTLRAHGVAPPPPPKGGG